MIWNIHRRRLTIKIALLVAIFAAIAVPTLAFYFRGMDKPETWITATAALAVITSIFSVWSSRRVVELQEDALRANPYPKFDFTSRYGLAMLRVSNMGGTAAHKISLHWDIELKDDNGQSVGFSMEDGMPAITILLPGESISKILGAHHSFMKNHPDTEYTGSITFEDPSGNKYKQPFRLDGRPFESTPSYDQEVQKTHYELQKLPEEIKKLRNAIEKFKSR